MGAGTTGSSSTWTVSCGLAASSRDCPNFSAKHLCPNRLAPHLIATSVKLAGQHPHETTRYLAIMGGGGNKVPYALFLNASPGAQLTPLDTQSTSGRRPEVGTHNPRTGKATRPSWALSSAASLEWPGWSAPTSNTATRCPNRVDSSPADSMPPLPRG